MFEPAVHQIDDMNVMALGFFKEKTAMAIPSLAGMAATPSSSTPSVICSLTTALASSFHSIAAAAKTTPSIESGKGCSMVSRIATSPVRATIRGSS